ncbi:precorrin-2/cobalt-factor-2 C20-methyltransferase [Comamonas sp. BIGb0152]|uniref:precorrin-2 C(20)-methyltransferase n=1 Tax=Comamonas sp. BIGb0152 TaxID=2940601 RepID=UPI00216902FD|nr:precorrin-2 C(20)-methyltransferase [Comamonas sp. BIGb0152]MCS4293826.1 precorrin-2/cobalt-factor-2 C20-methyltransferase [Comamonas sp. BIGb0152]
MLNKASLAAPGIICVGLGPGDPELMSIKADRLVRGARHVAFFRKKGRPGKARQLVDGMLSGQAAEYPMEYPVTTEIPVDSPAYVQQLAQFYDDWCLRLAALAKHEQVIVLCEGDPFLYGSFMHLYTRLRARGDVDLQVVPGIPGMVGCWHATGEPITWGDDVLSVMTGTLSEDELVRRMDTADALVVMKVGRNLPRIRRALARAGRADAAWLVQNGTTDQQQVARLSDVGDEVCPYFAIVLVHGQGRRPEAAW